MLGQFVSYLRRRNYNFLQVRRIYATAEIAKSQVLCISSWHFNMKYEAVTSLYYPCEIANQKWRLAWNNWVFKSTLNSRKFYVFLFHKKPTSHSTRAFLYDSFASWKFPLLIRGLKVQEIWGRHSFFRPSTKSIYCLDWEILCIISAICFMLPMYASSFILSAKHFDDSICLFSTNFKFEKLLFSKSNLISTCYFYKKKRNSPRNAYK